MEVEEAMFIEDLDPKHYLRCKLSRRTVDTLGSTELASM
jgi:hypothetical protein